jgi:hypothetical protein
VCVSFSGSCLVNSSLSAVWLFMFACYPQVQEIRSVTHQLSLCLFTGDLFLCLSPFSGAMSVIHQLAPCCQFVVMVCCSFFNFAEPLDFGCCSLAQEMNFVVCYQPYFRQWLITCLLSRGDYLLAPPPFFSARSESSPPLLCSSFQFIVNHSGFFLCAEVSLPRELFWFVPGVAGGILCDAWHSPLWSAECLPSRFGTGNWLQWQPTCFLSVMWLGVAFHGIRVQGVIVLNFLGPLFPPSVAPVSQQSF